MYKIHIMHSGATSEVDAIVRRSGHGRRLQRLMGPREGRRKVLPRLIYCFSHTSSRSTPPARTTTRSSATAACASTCYPATSKSPSSSRSARSQPGRERCSSGASLSSHYDTTCVTTVCSSYSLDYLVHLVYFEAPVDWLLDHPAPKDDVLSSPGCRLSVGIRNIDIALSEHEERIH